MHDLNEIVKVKVDSIIEETTDSKTYYLVTKTKLNYTHGQFIYVRVEIDGNEHYRPYSITSAPHENEITIMIKRVRNGLVSNYLNDYLKIGDTLEIMPPRGEFYIEHDEEAKRQYFFLAVGSGIAPVFSNIKSILKEESNSQVALFYGNRSEDYIIYYRMLEKLSKEYPGKLDLEHILSSPKKHRKPGLKGLLSTVIKWEGAKGHINDKTIFPFINRYKNNELDDQYFICGPDEMLDNLEMLLLNNGVPQEKIHTESFQQKNVLLPKGGQVDKCDVKVTYKGKEYHAQIDGSKPILENLLKSGVVIPFACRSGFCTSCLVKVREGEVETRVTKGLKSELRDLNYVLSCQSIPKTKSLALDFDSYLLEKIRD